MTVPPPVFISQEATPSVAGSSSPAELGLWNYAFTLYSVGELTFAVTWNGTRTVAYTMTPAGITAESGPAPVIREAGEDADDPQSYVQRTIVFEKLDVREVQSARVSAEEASLPAKAPSIDVRATVTATDLRSFFEAVLLPSSASVWPVEIRGFYAYTLDGGAVTVPVVLVPRHEIDVRDISLFEQIESTYAQWFAAAEPSTRDARVALELTIWSPSGEGEEPLLHFADVSLPFKRP